MFAKLSALVLALPLVSALTVSPLLDAQTGSTVTITWTASTTDPLYVSFELQNPAFNKDYAIANNVQTALGSITITLPQVEPGDDYNLVVIAVNNINDVLSTSSTFSIGATSSSSSASSTTSSTSSTSSESASTLSPTSTSPVSSSSFSAVTPSTLSSSTSAASSTPSSFNSNGATGFTMPGMIPAAGVLLSAVAGAALVF